MARKQKWSNQKIVRRIFMPVIVVLLLIALGIGGMVLLNKPTPTLVGIGQSIDMSVEQDQETAGSIFGYQAGFPWASGTMRLTVNSAGLYSSVTDAGIDPAECAYSIGNDGQFLLLQVTLENVDAQLYDEMNFSIGSVISAQAFEGWNAVSDKFRTVNPVYFSEHRPVDAESRDYFHGELRPGDTKTFQLGFAVSDLPEELVLELGNNGRAHKYGVRLGNPASLS